VSGSAHPPARKRFGQHFLEAAWVAKLIASVAPASDETFLEVGPGRGALTGPLAARAARVIAVEIDRDLARALSQRLPELRVVCQDFLETDLEALLADEHLPVRVVGNLPYNVASPILFHLLGAADSGRRIRDATVMLQREVAERVLAQPGSREHGSLALQIGLHAQVERVLSLPPGAFRPPPKVRSAVVRLRFRPPVAEVGDAARFERLVRGVFERPRKTLLNALRPVADAFGHSAPEIIERAGLDGGRRPGTLSIEEMARLSRAML
jgi:16S rRNA (adenine1518-N6/adenine1519-N6)-dimethyltransferase